MKPQEITKERISILLMLPLVIWASLKFIEAMSSEPTETQIITLLCLSFIIGFAYRMKQFIDMMDTL